MGIDVHGLEFLRYEKQQRGDFGSVLMLGRQELHLNALQIERILGIGNGRSYGRHAEGMLESRFGATSVDSMDNSDFEGATLIGDLNVALTAAPGPFDVVLDYGTLEHVFDVSTALSNVSALASTGGRILHVLPANQFCGHGFWQFAPELFFSLYTEANGYEGTEVFVAELAREKRWWKVRRPVNGERVCLHSPRPMYVMCRTTKARNDVEHHRVQQSDYVHVWESAQEQAGPSPLKEMLLGTALAPALWFAGRQNRNLRFRWSSGVNSRNPHLSAVTVP